VGGLLFWGMLDMVCGRLWCGGLLLAESAVPYIRENLKHFLDSNPDACMPSWKIHGCTEISTIAKFSCILYIELLILKPHRNMLRTLYPSYPFFPHCTFFRSCIK